jgi:hypothetical protein
MTIDRSQFIEELASDPYETNNFFPELWDFFWAEKKFTILLGFIIFIFIWLFFIVLNIFFFSFRDEKGELYICQLLEVICYCLKSIFRVIFKWFTSTNGIFVGFFKRHV